MSTESVKTRKQQQHNWVRFWIAGEDFGQHVTLVGCILQIVANFAFLKVHINQQARLYCCLETQDCNT